jgi:enterochelin esterase-like enzyme
MPRLTFEVTIPIDPTRNHVVIVGTDPALGNWQPERGLALERGEDGKFRAAADLPYGLVEFKVTRGSWETEEAYADGSLGLNYKYLVAHDLDICLEVDYWRDCPPMDPELVYGKTIECELDATQLGHHRRVIIWLPPSFMKSQDSRHPVLYLLDGQDSLSSLRSPDNMTLEVDNWTRRLARRNLIPELILVSVFHREDFGLRDEELSPQCDGPKMADFLVNDLKPFVDWTFCRDRTLPEPDHSGIMGFGLAGSLALWMAMRHAGSFGRFACLSPSYEDLSADPPDQCELLRQIAADSTFRPSGRRIYFDHGTMGGDQSVAYYQRELDSVLSKKGFKEGKDYVVNVAHGADHSLTAWRARLGAPLTFLFGKAES